MEVARLNFWKQNYSAQGVNFHLRSVFLAVAFLTTIAESLMCFQCASTAPDGGDCLNDHSGMVNATKRTGSLGYLKNCTDTHTNPPFNRCFIEYHLGPDDEFIFYHRGCHDGVTFNKKVASSTRFQNLPPNNETTCAKPPLMLTEVVCFSFCNTNLCNGPQLVPEKPDPCKNESGSFETGDECNAASFKGQLHWSLLMLTVFSMGPSFAVMQLSSTFRSSYW